MSNIETVSGIVVSETEYKENDKMLTVITGELGRISISAKGAKKQNSRFLACSQLFCYSNLTLYSGKNGIYSLSDCSLIDSFYNLRTDYDTLILATNIAKLASKVSQEECEDRALLRLLLNTLHFLAEGKKNPALLDCIFKIRIVMQQGFLDIGAVNIDSDFGKAVYHIATAPMEKLFAFSVSDDILDELRKYAKTEVNEMLESI